MNDHQNNRCGMPLEAAARPKTRQDVSQPSSEELPVAAQATPLRRQPMQQRSAERVERMLDACASLLDELGYERLTTTLIAERAGVAVGSLYQFFPDKRAVVQALAMRTLEHYIAAASERLAAINPQTWWDVVDAVLEEYLRMHRATPGFTKVHFGDVIDTRLMDQRRGNNTQIAEAFGRLIADRIDLPVGDVLLPVSVAVEAVDGVLRLAFRRDPKGDQVLVDEAKKMVRGYLSSTFGPA